MSEEASKWEVIYFPHPKSMQTLVRDLTLPNIFVKVQYTLSVRSNIHKNLPRVILPLGSNWPVR
jgi:hypothetical protein